MPMLLVLALLPFIYVLAVVLSPLLVALYSIVTVAEKFRTAYGQWSELVFFAFYIALIVYCGKSRWFFWCGLLPVTVITIVIARG